MSSTLSSTTKRKMDILAKECAKLPQASYELNNIFTPGLYLRQGTIPAGQLWVTRIHKTTHPFILLKGKIEMINEAGDHRIIEAPHMEITVPDRQRVIIFLEETILVTVHANPTDETDHAKIMEEITYWDNPLLPEEYAKGYLNQPQNQLLCPQEH